MTIHYAGIDLGTTNSAICTWDGMQTRIWKSPEQNDVTPSVIYVDRRGNKFYGQRAYGMAANSPDNVAMLFKRLMGSSSPIALPGANVTLTPEQASAEILKVLFGYLPEEIRLADEMATVITVPAAFNQMQKDATRQAAEMAGIGRVALMQEPVAAVMAVMRKRKNDGVFMVYDLGGGTLDIAIADSLGGSVTLLAEGGIPMCGGRDFDRAIVDNVVKPWLLEVFELNSDFSAKAAYGPLGRLMTWAAEKAKIELSAREEVIISLSEAEVRAKDGANREIYLEAPMDRKAFDQLIDERITESIGCARETIVKAGLRPEDVERIIFVGGPTHYKPLRDRVSFELGIAGGLDVNPMTAVAEGAAIFAEAIDWSSQSRGRKSCRGQLTGSGMLDVTFAFQARTPERKARLVVQMPKSQTRAVEFQLDSITTGWTSGRMVLKDGSSVDLPLPNLGEHAFRVFVYDGTGQSMRLPQERISITRTAATVDAIPASHTLGLEVLEKIGGRRVLERIVHAGDHLPKTGIVRLKAGETLKAGSLGELVFNVWEGDIDEPISDNRAVGAFKIRGSDFEGAAITAGADIECSYTVLDSGALQMEVSVPSITATFAAGRQFYSRQEGQHDYASGAAAVVEEGEVLVQRINQLRDRVDDPALDDASARIEEVIGLDPDSTDAENTKRASDTIQETKGILNGVRKRHIKEIRQMELDLQTQIFTVSVRSLASTAEAQAFDALVAAARQSIARGTSGFEEQVDEMRSLIFIVLWRQDSFVISFFRRQKEAPWQFTDQSQFQRLTAEGTRLLRVDDIDGLRRIVGQLWRIRSGDAPAMSDIVNVIRN